LNKNTSNLDISYLSESKRYSSKNKKYYFKVRK